MDVRGKLVELFYDNNVRCDQKIEGLADDVMDIISNVATEREWISVKDRMPEENTTVLVATDYGIVFQCLYAYDGWDSWKGDEENITHWQSMPNPPK